MSYSSLSPISTSSSSTSSLDELPPWLHERLSKHLERSKRDAERRLDGPLDFVSLVIPVDSDDTTDGVFAMEVDEEGTLATCTPPGPSSQWHPQVPERVVLADRSMDCLLSSGSDYCSSLDSTGNLLWDGVTPCVTFNGNSRNDSRNRHSFNAGTLLVNGRNARSVIANNSFAVEPPSSKLASHSVPLTVFPSTLTSTSTPENDAKYRNPISLSSLSPSLSQSESDPVDLSSKFRTKYIKSIHVFSTVSSDQGLKLVSLLRKASQTPIPLFQQQQQQLQRSRVSSVSSHASITSSSSRRPSSSSITTPKSSSATIPRPSSEVPILRCGFRRLPRIKVNYSNDFEIDFDPQGLSVDEMMFRIFVEGIHQAFSTCSSR